MNTWTTLCVCLLMATVVLGGKGRKRNEWAAARYSDRLSGSAATSGPNKCPVICRGQPGISGIPGLDGEDGQPGLPGNPGQKGEPGPAAKSSEVGSASVATKAMVFANSHDMMRAENLEVGTLLFVLETQTLWIQSTSGFTRLAAAKVADKSKNKV